MAIFATDSASSCTCFTSSSTRFWLAELDLPRNALRAFFSRVLAAVCFLRAAVKSALTLACAFSVSESSFFCSCSTFLFACSAIFTACDISFSSMGISL
ncbi:MAG: hypothetical protein CME43_04885 [Haliea sp.]|nr:hypothetical protein [Haliea sp.]